MAQETPQLFDQFNLEALPKGEIQELFADFLPQRQAVRAYYTAIPEESFAEGIAENSNSARQEIIHQIEHGYARTKALKSGTLLTYKYRETFPELAILDNLDKQGLIEMFDQTALDLYSAYANPNMKSQIVNLPYRKVATRTQLLKKIVYHEVLHLGMLVKIADFFEIARPQEMKSVWG